MINIKDEEKLQILVDNQSELNYRELTNFLELPYLRGNSKDKQLSELSKICVERCTIFGGSFRYYILYFIQSIILYIGLNNTIGFFKTHYIIIWQFTPTVFS